jgi:hypothetical protein
LKKVSSLYQVEPFFKNINLFDKVKKINAFYR